MMNIDKVKELLRDLSAEFEVFAFVGLCKTEGGTRWEYHIEAQGGQLEQTGAASLLLHTTQEAWDDSKTKGDPDAESSSRHETQDTP